MAAVVQGRLVEVEQVAVEAAERRPAGAEKAFRAYDPDQVLLMAPVLGEWVPEGDLAHFVSDVVEHALDLEPVYAAYEDERGFPPYDPRLVVKLIVYGYATGVVSSRKLEQATYRDVAVRMLCAGQHPDFRSIGRFRKRHLDALGELFVQALRLCAQAGLVGLGALALDGTKLRANASRHKAMSYERMSKAEGELEGEIAELRARAAELLERAEATDEAEDERFGERRGDELPDELACRESRLAKIREAKAALEAEAAERDRARREQAEREGRRVRRRDDDEPPKPEPRAQRNFTDSQSKIMKTADGSFAQCFNAQAVVDDCAQVIVACEVCDQAPDARQLEPALDQLDDNLKAIDAKLKDGATLAADAGYFSEDNVQSTVEHGLDAHIATGKQKHGEPPPPPPRGRIPKDATPKQRMARKLKTKNARAVYAKRKTIVEPVFGQIQTVQNGRQLLLRGRDAARAQWRLHCAIHNLLKLHRAGGLALLPAS